MLWAMYLDLLKIGRFGRSRDKAGSVSLDVVALRGPQ